MNFSNASLKTLSVHFVGNKSSDQGLVLSKKPLDLDTALQNRIKDYFLNRFVSIFDTHSFSHPSSLQYNEVYNVVAGIFSGENSFHLASVQLAQHLYKNSGHPKIKGGEFYVCAFENCIFENETVNAFGIFKTETKTNFFEVSEEKSRFTILLKEGIDINKLDKGCLIFNTKHKEGFRVLMVDTQSRGEEAQYWKEDFLGLAPVNNEFQQTNQFLSMTKNFVTQQMVDEFDMNKTDQIDLLNRSVDYFKKNETFDKSHFEKEVFQDKGLIKSFHAYDETYRQEHEIDLNDRFDISVQAVKRQARVFKSVLKLDKNFHIYIHGDKQLIEQGVEKDGRKFYKIYYNVEN
ncbi:MAG: nucleoid-associated protein [Bacteroidia bacterium]|nr:nucleoid-associated protein [Bacteroidia bacterium]